MMNSDLTQVGVGLKDWVSRFLFLNVLNTFFAKIREGAAKWNRANDDWGFHFQVHVHSSWVNLKLEFV